MSISYEIEVACPAFTEDQERHYRERLVECFPEAEWILSTHPEIHWPRVTHYERHEDPATPTNDPAASLLAALEAVWEAWVHTKKEFDLSDLPS